MTHQEHYLFCISTIPIAIIFRFLFTNRSRLFWHIDSLTLPCITPTQANSYNKSSFRVIPIYQAYITESEINNSRLFRLLFDFLNTISNTKIQVINILRFNEYDSELMPTYFLSTTKC